MELEPTKECAASADENRRAAVFFVGNQLMMDDGLGHAAFELLQERYCVDERIQLLDVGCMTMDMVNYVRDCDFVMTVDAVDGSGHPAGTVFRYLPDDVARRGVVGSLHDLKLADLFDAAMLLGYGSVGLCLGMQVLNSEPSEYVIGLSEPCAQALPLLVETIAAELAKQGFSVCDRAECGAEDTEGKACDGR